MTPQKSAPVQEQPSRKAWIRKSPAEIMIEQITKQEGRVQQMREELAHEERELEKLQAARKVLESQ